MMYCLDIETLSTDSRAVVLSIGIMYIDDFSPKSYTDLFEHSLFIKLDAKYQIENLARDVDRGTVDWWGKQSEAARRAAIFPSPDDVTPTEAFDLLRGFVYTHTKQKRVECYTRGSMDSVVIEHLAKQVGSPLPFKYNDYRDVRTAVSLLYPKSTDGYVEVDPELCYNFNVNDVIKHHPVHDVCYDIAMLLYGKN